MGSRPTRQATKPPLTAIYQEHIRGEGVNFMYAFKCWYKTLRGNSWHPRGSHDIYMFLVEEGEEDDKKTLCSYVYGKGNKYLVIT